MANTSDDNILINLSLDETTVNKVENRIRNLISKYKNQNISVNINSRNLENVENRLISIQEHLQRINSTPININFTQSQRQYQLETERLRTAQALSIERERTAQSENNAIRALAQEHRTLTVNRNIMHQINQDAQGVAQNMHNAGINTGNFVDYLANGVRYLATYRTLQIAINNIRDSLSEMKKVDSSLVSVKKVTGMSDSEIETIRKSSYGVATDYGKIASEYLSSVSEFAKGGYKERSTELGKLSLLSQNVGDISDKTANSMLLSIDAAYRLNGDLQKLTRVIDGLNSIANKNPTSMEKMAEGLQVSASMAKTAGLDISEITSLIATGTATTQREGAEISRAVRSILMNITETKGELEDGTIIDSESMAKAESALKGIGIQTKEVINGVRELRSPMIILDELADKWQSLGSEAKNAIMSDLADKRHANVLSNILSRWDMVEKTQKEYFDSMNSAIIENSLYLDSWEAKSARLSSKWTEYVSGVVDTSLIKGSLDVLFNLLSALDTPLGRIATQIILINTSLSVSRRLWTQIRTRSIIADIIALGVQERNLGLAIQMVNGHLLQQARAFATSPFGWIILATTVITGLVKGYDALIGRQEKLARTKLEDLNKDISKYDDEISALEELQSKLESSKGNKSELAQIQNELNNAVGETAGLLNGESKAYDIANTKLKANIELKKQQREEALKNKVNASSELFDNNVLEISHGTDISAKRMRSYADDYNKFTNEFNSLSEDDQKKKIYKTAGHYASTMLDIIGENGNGVYIDPIEWENYWNEQVETAYNIFDDVISSYNGIGGQEFIKNIISNMVRNGSELSQIHSIVQEVMGNEDLQTTINSYWESLVNPDIDSQKALISVKKVFDDVIKEYPELTALFNNFYKQIISGGEAIAKSSQNIDTTTASLETLNKQLDDIQSAYNAVKSAISEYNSQGTLSVDTYQSLMELEPQYLNMLIDENGNLNLNTDAVNENTKAYIENLGVKSAEALVNNLSKYTTEKEQLDFLTGSLNENTEATWANVYSKLAELSLSDDVHNAAVSRINAIQQMTQAAINGIGSGGLGKAASDTSNKIKDTQDKLEDLAKSEALDKLKYKFDLIEQSIEKINSTISLLDGTLDMTAEDDHIGKLEITTRQLELARQKSILLSDEFAQLQKEEYNSADSAQELANRMKSVADSIADNQKSIMEYGKNIAEYYTTALTSISTLSKGTLDEATNLIERNIKSLSEGGLIGLDFTLSPTVPQSAIEKQRSENQSFEKEMQRHYDAVAQMQKIALDLKYQEQVADHAREREELLKTLNETKATVSTFHSDVIKEQKETNDKTSAEQEADNAQKEAEAQNFANNLKGIVTDVNAWMAANPILAPELDKTSWQRQVDEAKSYAEQVRGAWSDIITNKTPTVLNSGSGNKNINSIVSETVGTPYVAGGESTSGFDCSGLALYVLKKLGKNPSGRTSQDMWNNGGTRVDESNLQVGDLVFYDWQKSDSFGNGEGPAHVAVYIGDGKILNASSTNGKVEVKNFDSYWRSAYYGAKRYAKGTQDYGIAGENYKKEYAINKKTGEWSVIDSPTLFDKKEYDIVGEKVSEKIDKPIDTFAKGTIYPSRSGLGKTHSYTWFNEDGYLGSKLGYWDKDSASWKLFQNLLATGELTTDENGIYMYKGMRLAATTDKWGQVGDVMKVNQDGGNPYYIIKMDTKRTTDPGATQDGHYGGECIVEFEVKKSDIDPEYKKYGGTPPHGDLNHAVTSIENLGNIFSDFDLSAVSTDVSSIASSTATVAAFDFNSALKELNEMNSASPDAVNYQEDLLSYIKENASLQEEDTDNLLSSWENLNEYNNKQKENFALYEKQLSEAIGTRGFDSLRDFVSDEMSSYTGAMIKVQTDVTAQGIKNSFDRSKSILDTILKYYNERKEAGANADELNVIKNAYSEQAKTVQELSDSYVSTLTTYTDYLVGSAEREMRTYQDLISWKENFVEDLERKLGEAEGLGFNSIAKDLISANKEMISVYEEQKRVAHENAEALRNDETYKWIFERFDTESWFDAKGEQTAKFEIDKENYSITNPELIPVINRAFELIQVWKKEFYEAEDSIIACTDAIDDLSGQIPQKTIDALNDAIDNLVEGLDFKSHIEDLNHSALSSLSEFEHSLREHKFNASINLETNKELEQWLDPESRKLLFNDDDYAEYIDGINAIEESIRADYNAYIDTITNLNYDERYKEEAITAQWERQLEIKKEELDTLKDEMNTAKATLEYTNAAKERDTQIIMGNRVLNVADPERLHELAQKKAEAQSQAKLNLEKIEDNSELRAMAEANQVTKTEIAALQQLSSDLGKLPDEMKQAFVDSLPKDDYLQTLFSKVAGASMDAVRNGFFATLVPSILNIPRQYLSDRYDASIDYSAEIDKIPDYIERGLMNRTNSAGNLTRDLNDARVDKTATDPDYAQWHDGSRSTNYGLNERAEDVEVKEEQPKTVESEYPLFVQDFLDKYSDDYMRGIEDILNARKDFSFTTADLILLKALETERNRKIYKNGFDKSDRLYFWQSSNWGGLQFDDEHPEGASEKMISSKTPSLDLLKASSLMTPTFFDYANNFANYLVGKESSVKNTEYNFGDIVITNPVKNGDELFAEFARKVKDKVAITNNMSF